MPAESNGRNIQINQDGSRPSPYQDRSFTINHNGVPITWTPRDQLVPPTHLQTPTPRLSDTSLNPTTPKRKLASNPKPASILTGPHKTIMLRLKRALFISKPSQNTTKVLQSGVADLSLFEGKKEGLLNLKGFWGMGRRESKGKGREEYVRVPRRDFEALSRFAVAEARVHGDGKQLGSISFVCKGCGNGRLSVVTNERGFCEVCREMVEGDGDNRVMSGGVVERERSRPESNEWVKILRPLEGPTAMRNEEFVRRAEEMISASSVLSPESSHSSLYSYSYTSRRVNSEKVLRSTSKWRFRKGCTDGKCGIIAEDDEGPYVNTCSEDSWLFVNNKDQAIIQLTAAPKGSPRHEQSASSSPKMEITPDETAQKALRELQGLPPKHPLLFVDRNAHLESAPTEAVNTPLSPHKDPYASPPNASEPCLVAAPVTERNLAIHASAHARNDNEREVLNIPHPASTEVYRNKTVKELWLLLKCADDITPSPTEASLVEKLRDSFDATSAFPSSLDDSEICAAVIEAWTTRNVLTPSPPPPSPSSLRTNSRNSSLRDAREFVAPTPTPSPPPEMSRGQYFEAPPPMPSHRSCSPDSLMRDIDSSYFDRVKQLDRSPSPLTAPPPSLATSGTISAPRSPAAQSHILSPELPPDGYPALDGSATTLEYGFHPTLQMDPAQFTRTPSPPQICSMTEPPTWSELRKNRKKLFGTDTSPPTSPSPAPRTSEEWSNNCRSLFGKDPEPYIRNVRLPEVRVRGGGRVLGDAETGKKVLDEKIDVPDYYLVGRRKGRSENWKDLCEKLEMRVEKHKEIERAMKEKKKLKEAEKGKGGTGQRFKRVMITVKET